MKIFNAVKSLFTKDVRKYRKYKDDPKKFDYAPADMKFLIFDGDDDPDAERFYIRFDDAGNGYLEVRPPAIWWPSEPNYYFDRIYDWINVNPPWNEDWIRPMGTDDFSDLFLEEREKDPKATLSGVNYNGKLSKNRTEEWVNASIREPSAHPHYNISETEEEWSLCKEYEEVEELERLRDSEMDCLDYDAEYEVKKARKRLEKLVSGDLDEVESLPDVSECPTPVMDCLENAAENEEEKARETLEKMMAGYRKRMEALSRVPK